MDRYPLISVIVPIYMIDRYLGVCIESILHQTYHNMEIILVDDGGMDLCAEICDLYAKKDSRIKVIHKPNGGLVSARKAGLREANGEYVSYVDGDDWIGAGFIESLYTAARASGADMVCAGHSRDLFGRTASFTNPLPAGIYEGLRMEELWGGMISYGSFYRPGITTYVWNKLFRKDVLLHPQLAVNDGISIGEDAAVTYPALFLCRKAAVIDNVAYHYRQREDSMLKRSSGFADEAQRLRCLYDGMMQWAESTPAKYGMEEQTADYILSLCIVRSGGLLFQDGVSAFDKPCEGREVVVYSAGTFGQQMVSRFRGNGYCNVVGWIDDDYWEYRRCCLDVDPVETVTKISYDCILVATVDANVAEGMVRRLLDYGVAREKILTVDVPADSFRKRKLMEGFLDMEIYGKREENRKAEGRAYG